MKKTGTKKKRNHYVPRFLLNFFASRDEKGKYWVFQYRKGHRPKEISTRDVAVGSFFYGRDQVLEDALAENEDRMKPIIEAVVCGEPPAKYAEALSNFVYLLSVHTRALRFGVVDSLKGLPEELFGDEQAPRLVQVLRNKFESGYDQKVKGMAMSLPKNRRKGFLKRARKERKKAIFGRQVETFLERLNMEVVLGIVRKHVAKIDFAEATGTGQVKGLAMLLEAGKTPEPLLTASWNVVKRELDTYILGDASVFAMNDEGEAGSLLRFDAASWKALFLPLSPRRLLVASRAGCEVALSDQEVNKQSAMVARDALFSSAKIPDGDRLSSLIGSGAPLVFEAEMAEISEESWQEMLGKLESD